MKASCFAIRPTWDLKNTQCCCMLQHKNVHGYDSIITKFMNTWEWRTWNAYATSSCWHDLPTCGGDSLLLLPLPLFFLISCIWMRASSMIAVNAGSRNLAFHAFPYWMSEWWSCADLTIIGKSSVTKICFSMTTCNSNSCYQHSMSKCFAFNKYFFSARTNNGES